VFRRGLVLANNFFHSQIPSLSIYTSLFATNEDSTEQTDDINRYINKYYNDYGKRKKH